MSGTLGDLAAEYCQAAQNLTQMLEHGNQLIRKARENGEYERLRTLRVRQLDTYKQRAHVLQIAEQLKTYYNTSNCSVG